MVLVGVCLIDAIAEWSLTGWWPVRGLVLIIAVVAVGLLIWRGRQWWSRAGLVLLLLVVVPINCLAAVNAYYGYFLTVGQAIGMPGRDAATLATLNRHTEPTHGQVVAIDIPGKKSRTHPRAAEVYLPPAWFAHRRPHLPVMMMLHGNPGAPTDWSGAGQVPQTLDAWAAAHHGVAPIVVMPDVNNGNHLHDTECVDSPRGNEETYLTEDVPKFVQSRFFTLPPGRSWGVGGFSEGGSCSIMLALRHPDLFRTFLDFGGLSGPRIGENDHNATSTVNALFHGSEKDFQKHEPSDLLKQRRYPMLGGWFEQGNADPQSFAAATKLASLSEKAGIATRMVTVPGAAHTFTLWRAAFNDALSWTVARLVPPEQHRRSLHGGVAEHRPLSSAEAAHRKTNALPVNRHGR
jgi:enterochelin esterase-like enzyme